jgi:translation initiation factor IF-3
LKTGDRTIAKDLRCNERIRISPIRLIDQDDQQVGIVETRQAQQMALEAGLDLVEVAPQARPPVCRIIDYGKWKYAERKKEQKSKAVRHETELKEVRIKTPKIGARDLEIKVDRARGFLGRGDRVQFTLRFRGRELAHIDEGQRIFQQIKESLADVAKVDQDYRREGRRITMTLRPIPLTAS